MQPATESDQEVWEELLRAAEQAATHGFAPCAYLGLRTGEGRYEPDPAKWQCPFLRQPSKYQATVFYEWLYVRQGFERKPYRVPMRVEGVLRATQDGGTQSSVEPCCAQWLVLLDAVSR